MKTLTKAILICGCVMFFGGLLLALVGLALGGQSQIVAQRLGNMGVISYWGWHDDYRAWDSPPIPPAPPTPTEPAKPEAPDEPDKPEPPMDGIRNLNFSFGTCDVTISRGEDFGIIYGNDRAERFYYQRLEGNTWIIGTYDYQWSWLDSWRFGRNTFKIAVVLPYDFEADSVNIDLGLGNLQAEQLFARNMNLTVGLGNLEINSFHADKLHLDVGLGNADLTASRPISDYRYDVEVGLGSVTVGKSSYSGVADAQGGSQDAPYQINIKCGLGSATVAEGADRLI